MTTYLLLVLHDDGRSRMVEMPGSAVFDAFDVLRFVEPVRSGFDRGPYRTYEAANFSIDVTYQKATSA